MDTPYSLLVVDEVSSTQDLARSRAASAGNAVVIAHRQTAGRGRGGSAWETAPRAVAVSLAFRPEWRPEHWSVIPLCAGVAARRTLGPGVDLKWPNDLLDQDGKVGGILVEAADDLVVAGMGLNLHWSERPPGAGALFESDPGAEAGPSLATRWVDELLEILSKLPDDWPREEYRDACVTLGTEIAWEPKGEGKATDVAADGSLIVHLGTGAEVRLRSGEVRHVRRAG